jgi:hypothetical protein
LEDPVHRARDPGAEGHHAATERAAVSRLYDKVGMRVL